MLDDAMAEIYISPKRRRKKTTPDATDPLPPNIPPQLVHPVERTCIICGDSPCNERLHTLANHDEAWFPFPFDEESGSEVKKCWLRCVKRGGKEFLGCWPCMTHLGKNSVKAASGNVKVHKGNMPITDKLSLDTLIGHLGYEANDARQILNSYCNCH